MTTMEQPQRTLTARVVFTAPGQQANGLAAAPEGLWICDQRNDHCYLVRYDTGATISAFPSPVRNASGIAYGAGSVWPAANRLPAATYRHDARTGHCLADLVFPDGDRGGVHGIEWAPTDPAALAALPPAEPPPPPLRREAPGGELAGQRGAAGTLWVTRPGLRIIQWVDAETGELLRTIPFPEERSHGIYWDEADRSIVCAETNHNHIYRLDVTDGTIREMWVVDSITGPRDLASGSLHGDETMPRFDVHGMTRDADGRIWACDAATNLVAVLED